LTWVYTNFHNQPVGFGGKGCFLFGQSTPCPCSPKDGRIFRNTGECDTTKAMNRTYVYHLSHRKKPGNTKYVLDGHWFMEIDGIVKNTR
jgi:hypothetical protein